MKLLEIIKRNIREYLIEGKDSIDLYEIARWGLENEIVLVDDSDVEILSVKPLYKFD